MPIILDGWAGNLPTIQYSTSQDVTVSGTSSQSATVGLSTLLVRLCATTACRLVIGPAATATATTNSTLLPANVVEFTEINPGQVVAVLQESAGGKLNITECIIKRSNYALSNKVTT